ncbi:Mus7/MMS22 family-domain-containing protein [Podospora didyma]|uniref:Mus7/MMS22 family-domain-containing protein n=1 Tax=Podospora didyma TaxID=330526 RepID=A0AAE0NT47_9PEZI|nr:Mus7/MMS22 family-domain-containing protein [Podospora didyma]
MKNWRELGEVPDSEEDDDETLDSPNDLDTQGVNQISQVDNQANEVNQGLETETSADDVLPELPVVLPQDEPQTQQRDVWSFPSSSPEQALPSHCADVNKSLSPPLSEPPSSPLSVLEDSEQEHPFPSQQDSDDEVSLLPTEKPTSKPPKDESSTTVEQGFLGDDISASYVRITTPSPPPLPTLASTPSPVRPTPARSQALPSSSKRNGNQSDPGEELSRQEAVRLDRSLRPRKPIQKHPYLLENAQYTTAMKSHGIRPVKVVVETQPEQQATEEDYSPPQEFEAEETQEASRPMEDPEESPPILFEDDEPDDREELILSLSPPRSSSLPKTSSQDRLQERSSQPTIGDHTDLTNLSDDDLPSPSKLGTESGRKRLQNLKRQSSGVLSSRQKRQKHLSVSQASSPPRALLVPHSTIPDLSPSPTRTPAPVEQSQDIGSAPESSPIRRHPRPYPSSRRPPSSPTLPSNGPVNSPILIEEDKTIDSDSSSSTQNSASGSDVPWEKSRQIRHVLPASWLRLNHQAELEQQKKKPAARNVPKSRGPSPVREFRRGVAIPRVGSSRPLATAPLFDDSEESDAGSTRMQAGMSVPLQTEPNLIVFDEDDGASALEEDSVDFMLPPRKRKPNSNLSGRSKKRKSLDQLGSGSRSGQPSRQPKITQAFSRSKNASTASSSRGSKTRTRRAGRDGSSTKSSSRQRAVTPPLLSILDVIEPEAPRFMKIAARSVKRKFNLGKASPSRKIVSLATRRDNIDALSALRDWKSGKTQPKVAAPASGKPRRESPLLRSPELSETRAALQEIMPNSNPHPLRIQQRSFSSPRKFVRQGSLDGFVAVGGNKGRTAVEKPSASASRPLRRAISQARVSAARPAQLESDGTEAPRRRLNTKKRSLDAVYRISNQVLGKSADTGSDFSIHEDALTPPQSLPEPVDQMAADNAVSDLHPSSKGKRTISRTRFRKRGIPQCIDIDAPKYIYANDPLPAAFAAVQEMQERQCQDKLNGLGPYGTDYTTHFEVFPLDRGTFFHESTVIGRGDVRKAVDFRFANRIHHPRQTVSFGLDEQTLRWGAWNDNTSSEFGILVDWITEQLSSEAVSVESATNGRAVPAADFVLRYILDSFSVEDDVNKKAFLSRFIEVFSSFASRVESVDWAKIPETIKKIHFDVGARFLVATLAIRSLSQASGDDHMQLMNIEDLLKRSASVMVGRLLDFGLEHLRDLYQDLQRSSTRERGIRSDQVITNCWVVTIRVLESAVVPRCSFWDITHSKMLSPGVVSSSDSIAFEQLWRDMFTLLPLCEFDDCGILIPGLRITAPVEGWSLPQQLMKRVFQLYQANPRQPPSFNDYCRALVARCHYLIQQWGWRKCTGIIGTIFDFFGSQNLANLRNEEVYKSPRFLEELDGDPSLSIEKEDRCFHIFIKILALTIQRLKALGRPNDIRNLLTRTLPNHNRQYLKEDTIHQHDLAALRNHHDLLCTLFWVAPPELRPAIHLIEELVAPSSAHKEACLINIRAWNQLARFVISDDDGAAFMPFITWRNNVFNQVLDSYLSAASDIEQQFRALPSQGLGISVQVRDEIIEKNKATAMDVLHASVKGSLDVLQHAKSLEAIVYGLNKTQLQKVFTSLDFHSSGFVWGVLRVALDTVDHFLKQVDKASEEQYSSELLENVDSRHVENAVLLFHEYLTKDFFWMGRKILGLPMTKSATEQKQQAACVEKTVELGARIATRFIKERLTQLSLYFSPGKYGLFLDLPKDMNSADRKYLPLFLGVLVKNHIFDFKDLGMNIMGLWVLSIVKPHRFLGYENYLAETLKRHNLPFLDRATIPVEVTEDYSPNYDLFACALQHMRKALREAGSAQSRQLRDEFSKTLQLTMQKMKEDLALLRPDAAEHASYVGFVRRLISLIKSHGVGICVVDPFFTQPSLDYSPPMQDPLLHTAGIVAYGVRLSEKDVNAVPQLFHYLYNNFKIALGNDKLDQEHHILIQAMRSSSHIISFTLQFMLPAIIQASSQTPNAWLLLEIYVGALGDILTGRCFATELTGDDIDHAASLLTSLVTWFDYLRRTGSSTVSLEQLHTINLLTTVANMLQSSLRIHLLSESHPELEELINSLAGLFGEIHAHTGEILSLPPDAEITLESIRTGALLHGLLPPGGTDPLRGGISSKNNPPPRVQELAKTIILDIRKNWWVSDDRVRLQIAPAGGRATHPTITATQQAAGQGTTYGPWNVKEMLQRLRSGAARWKLGAEEVSRDNIDKMGRRGRRARDFVLGTEDLIF